MSIRSAVSILILTALAGSGCDAARRTVMAHGDESSIIIFAVDSLWAAVGDSVLTALEPRVFTVRDEKMFEATYVSPLTEDWLTLRTFRQVLTIGIAGDGWIEPALDGKEPPGALPALVETRDVWAQQQTVTSIVLPREGSAAALLSILPRLGERLDARYRDWVQNRMYMSEANTELRDSLRSQAGFSLVLPRIYTPEEFDSLYVFQNQAQVGGELIRRIVVASREGVEDVDEAMALDWRDAIAESISEPQVTERERIETHPVDGVAGAIQVQGIWRSADVSFPAAGPFVDRVIPCPAQNRTYFLEAWLYAPGRPKYQYIIQMETLLDSFECGPFDG